MKVYGRHFCVSGTQPCLLCEQLIPQIRVSPLSCLVAQHHWFMEMPRLGCLSHILNQMTQKTQDIILMGFVNLAF